MIQGRTDLALELQEELQESEIDGIKIERKVDKNCGISQVKIVVETKEAEQIIGKPMGEYITLESETFLEEDDSYYEDMSEALHFVLRDFIKEEDRVLIVGLGNDKVTPDALGPLVVENIFITRHLKQYDLIKEDTIEMSGLVPGVMAQTGMEVVEIVRGVVKEAKPTKVVVIDALCARNSSRLNKTIQISNTGISPGSGVGNHRKAMNEETIGVPVIAIGVPTVISVPSIVRDSMEAIFKVVKESGGTSFTEIFTEEEKYQLAREVVDPGLVDMFVTPKNIDEAVRRISFTISEAINRYIPLSK
ncbi:MAG: GPR endopeptidase [Firmicutes bacterium]|uniref:Germination protease n=1 Tax=Candidatus Scybalomonas excrementavium TaxID=2840943 RepID=A0A9D9HZJ1_9FIRM|nr:GPR endopeptidase [Candidatus Scybalomonas excrementavium]